MRSLSFTVGLRDVLARNGRNMLVISELALDNEVLTLVVSTVVGNIVGSIDCVM